MQKMGPGGMGGGGPMGGLWSIISIWIAMDKQSALYLLTQTNFQINVVWLSNKEILFQDIIELIKT